MAIEPNAAGLIVTVVTENDQGIRTDPHQYVIYCNNAKMVNCNATKGEVDANAFSLGIFQNIVQLLLALTKNKLTYGNACLIPLQEGYKVSDAVLNGLFISGPLESKENYISYATLPFVYLCDNRLGDGGVNRNTMPIYTFNADHQTFTQTGSVCLDKISGNFGIVADTTLALNNWTLLEVAPDVLTTIVQLYTAQFLASGYPNGPTLVDQLQANLNAITPQAVAATEGVAFGEVLRDIAKRWLDVPAAKKAKYDDYNIGAGLYLTETASSHTKYFTLMKSLNNKSVNRAAHAEVRISMLLDFLDAVRMSRLPNFNTAAFQGNYTAATFVGLATRLYNLTREGDNNPAGQLILFSSMLPCYLCEGTLESTESGKINRINGLDVGLWSGFLNVDTFSARVTNTFYYDIDSAIYYRTINVGWNRLYQNATVMRFSQVALSSFLPSNVEVTSSFGAQVPLSSLSIHNCGEHSPLVGVQNDETAIRYQLSGEIMSMYVGHSGTQNMR